MVRPLLRLLLAQLPLPLVAPRQYLPLIWPSHPPSPALQIEYIAGMEDGLAKGLALYREGVRPLLAPENEYFPLADNQLHPIAPELDPLVQLVPAAQGLAPTVPVGQGEPKAGAPCAHLPGRMGAGHQQLAENSHGREIRHIKPHQILSPH